MAAACAHQLVLTSRSADGRTWAVRASWTAPAPSADQEVGGGNGPMGAAHQEPRAYMSFVSCFMPLVEVQARRLVDLLVCRIVCLPGVSLRALTNRTRVRVPGTSKDKKSKSTSWDKKKITESLEEKKSLNPLTKKNHATSQDKKITQPLGKKKITKPLGSTKITKPLGTKNHTLNRSNCV